MYGIDAELYEGQYFLNFHNFSNSIILYNSLIGYIFAGYIPVRFVEEIKKPKFYQNPMFHKINSISVKVSRLPAISYYFTEFLATALISTNLLWRYFVIAFDFKFVQLNYRDLKDLVYAFHIREIIYILKYNFSLSSTISTEIIIKYSILMEILWENI